MCRANVVSQTSQPPRSGDPRKERILLKSTSRGIGEVACAAAYEAESEASVCGEMDNIGAREKSPALMYSSTSLCDCIVISSDSVDVMHPLIISPRSIDSPPACKTVIQTDLSLLQRLSPSDFHRRWPSSRCGVRGYLVVLIVRVDDNFRLQ